MNTQVMLNDTYLGKEIALHVPLILMRMAFLMQEFIKLCRKDRVLQIKHGYYQDADNLDLPEEQILVTVLPKAHLVCLESMLFYYGYSDLTSHVWSVMVPCNILLNKLEIDEVELDIRFALKDLYDIGKTIEDFNVIQLIIYDRDETFVIASNPVFSLRVQCLITSVLNMNKKSG